MKKALKKVLLFYLLVWLVIVAAFWFGLHLEPMFFSIVAFYVALPLTAFLVSLFLGRSDSHLKWLFIPFAGLMQFLAPFLTFGLANALTFDKNASLIMLPDIYSALFSIIPAIIGMFIGKTKLKEYFFSFLSGLDAEKLAEDFWNQNQHRIYKWYLDQQQPDDIIISASPKFLLQPICNRLGIHHLIASKVDPETGMFAGENCRGQEKVRRLEVEYRITHIDSFYSDSQSDLPLAQIADKAFLVVNGDLRKWEK